MKKGFLLTLGRKELFYLSEKQNITNNIACSFIEKIGEIKNLSSDLILRCKNDEATLKDMKYRISNATIENKTTDNGYEYYCIKGENFGISIPLDEAEGFLVIF